MLKKRLIKQWKEQKRRKQVRYKFKDIQSKKKSNIYKRGNKRKIL